MASAGLSREESENLKREIKKNWLPKNSRWIAPWYQENHNTDNNKAKKYSCDWPWRKMVINWDGSVSVCCGEYDPKNDMGNVLDEDIRTIWNNSRYVAARKSFTKGRSENHEANPSDRPGRPCDRCIGVLE
jgi:MoaA/NifB/PqqE/SkfB family radical SAM enzyme